MDSIVLGHELLVFLEECEGASVRSVDEEDPVEMVAFVLCHRGEWAIKRVGLRLPTAVPIIEANVRGPSDLTAQAGD